MKILFEKQFFRIFSANDWNQPESYHFPFFISQHYKTTPTFSLIEQWGSGLNRMSNSCLQQGVMPPKFEELDLFFRVTLYPKTTQEKPQPLWYDPLFTYI